MMLERQKTILNAAFDVFARYGVKRATMNDIASEAGVARQTLYNAFANKEAILQGLIEAHIAETLAAIEAHVASGGSLDSGLELVFDHVARRPFELLRNTPHGDEIMEGITGSAKQLFLEGNRKFSAAVAEIFRSNTPPDGGASPADLGEFVVYATMGMKHKAESKAHLERLLKTLKATVLSLTREARPYNGFSG